MAQLDDPTRKQKREAAREERKAKEAAVAHAAARRKRLTVLGGIVAAAAVVVVLLVSLSSPSDDGGTPAKGDGEAVAGQSATAALLDGVPQSGRSLGKSTAPVTLVEFADLQCPFCREYTEQALPTVIQDYVRTGKVRLEFRPRTFIGDDSVKLAKVVEASARQDKLWNTLDLLYANQGTENTGWATDAVVASVLEGAGVDAAKVNALKDGAAVQADLTAADTLADKNGLDSTPSFLIGKTGGTLKPLEVSALDATFFAKALDDAGKA